MRTPRAVLVAGGLVAVGATVLAIERRREADAVDRSWAGRNARVARLGARVGATYASTAARKTFASAERRVALADLAIATVESKLGASVDDLFVTFDAEPIAARRSARSKYPAGAGGGRLDRRSGLTL